MGFGISNLWKRKAVEGEEASSLPALTLSLPLPNLNTLNLVEEGSPRPFSTMTTMTNKPCGFGSNGSLLHLFFAGGALIVGAIFTRQPLFWCMDWPQKNNGSIMLQSNVNRFLRGKETLEEKERIDEVVVWAELPQELWGDIGRRLESRLDFTRFRSVCKRWRMSLPSPNRFPLQVPQPPWDSDSGRSIFADAPYFITEINIYSVDVVPSNSRGVQRVLVEFLELDQGGKFLPYALIPEGLKFDLPAVSPYATPDPEQQLSRLSFVAKTFAVRNAIPLFDPLKKRVEGKWMFRRMFLEVRKIVLISPKADGFNASYAPASDLSVVALMHAGPSLALLRLGESQDPNWGWDTGFCSGVFEDIATYKGQLCALDKSRRTFLMDYNSLEMTQVAAPFSINTKPGLILEHCDRHLFEACGDMYLVVVLLIHAAKEKCVAKVYKLNLRLGKWCEVDNIGNQVFHRDLAYNISIPRHIIANTYGSWMMKCNGDGNYFTAPSLLLGHKHKHGICYCFLGYSMQHYIPWHTRQEAALTPSTITPTSAILSQYDSSVVGRTNYMDVLRSARRRS